MSRVLAAFLTFLFSVVLIAVTQVVNPGETILSGGAMIAAALCIPVFLTSWGLEKFRLRHPRIVALVIWGLLCAVALHFGAIALAILAAFTVLQYALRHSAAFRLRRTA